MRRVNEDRHDQRQSPKSLLFLPAAIALALLGWASHPLPVEAATQSYVEDFTTTTYRDGANTTALWDTSVAEVRLHPFLHTLAGRYDTPDMAVGITISGDHAFVADQASGLQVIDISDPTDPALAGTYNTVGFAWDVVVSGDHAYVADGGVGLRVLDISDPTNPVSVGSIATPDRSWGVAVAGDHAYMADNNSGLQVIDISDPTSPAIVGSYDTPGAAVRVVVQGNYAFVADFASGLQIIDISDPTNPTLAGSYDTPDIARDVAVSGNMAWIADTSTGLLAIDISDPTNPGLAGTYNTPGLAVGLQVQGDRAFVADQVSGLQIIDITGPTNPVLDHNFDTDGVARDVVVSGDYAFVADLDFGVQVIDISDLLPNPVLIGSHDTTRAFNLAVSGDRAFIADWNSFRIFDISDPTNPDALASYPTPGPGFTQDVAVSGDYAFLARGSSGLEIIDVADPGNPASVGSYDTPGIAWDVVISGDHAFVGDGTSGLQVINISDPTNPTFAGNYDTPGTVNGVTVSGNYAYVVDSGSGLLVIDISDPTNPTFAGSYASPLAMRQVAVSGDHAYLAHSSAGLHVIDISDPTNPVFAGSYDTPGVSWDVAVSGNQAFVADQTTLQVLDISDPSNPMFAGSLDTPSTASGVAVAGARVFLADLTAGFRILQVRQSEVAPPIGAAQSLPVDGELDPIVRARVTSTETAGVSWELSVDAGSNWLPTAPGATWHAFPLPGDELLWRSTHNYSGVNPTVSNLTLDWLNEFAPIASVTDIPGDQGGWVRLGFTRSGYDFADETEIPVTAHQIYRRIDDASRATRIKEEGVIPERSALVGTPLASFEIERLRRFEGSEFLLGDSGARSARTQSAGAQGEVPPGTWEIVANVIAQQQESYTVALPTLADSTAESGIAWSVHFVSTHTTTPSIWFASEPDSGYSVDNIAPGVPANLVIESGNQLIWDPAAEEDFSHHTIYGSESPVFDETVVVLGYTVEPMFDITGQLQAYLHVTTSDHVGNESVAASIGNEVSSTPDGSTLPGQFAFRHAGPNPFRMGTAFEFDLPSAAPVQIEIYDASGRKLRQIVNGLRPPGAQIVNWDGRSETGLRAAPGVYFARIRAGVFEGTLQLILVQ